MYWNFIFHQLDIVGSCFFKWFTYFRFRRTNQNTEDVRGLLTFCRHSMSAVKLKDMSHQYIPEFLTSSFYKCQGNCMNRLLNFKTTDCRLCHKYAFFFFTVACQVTLMHFLVQLCYLFPLLWTNFKMIFFVVRIARFALSFHFLLILKNKR